MQLSAAVTFPLPRSEHDICKVVGSTCGEILATKWKINSVADFKDKIILDPSLLKNLKGAPHIGSVELVKALARDCAVEDMKKNLARNIAEGDYNGEITHKTESDRIKGDRHD